MNRFRLATCALLCSLLPLSACQTARQGASSHARATFAGTIQDNLGRPVLGAQVTIGGAVGRTGRDGRFQVAVRAQGPYGMVVQHPDFAYYSRILPGAIRDGLFRLTRVSRIVADPTQPIVVRDSRRPEDCVPVASVPGSALPCEPGFAVEIPANALVDASGNRPSGMVEVRIGTFEIQTESMPRPLLVAASDSDPTDVAMITSYGAGMVEIHDVATGRELNLAPSSRAHIEIPVHRVARQRSGERAPPATIPLFRFNPRMLRWVRIGTMPLVDGRYSAEVDHLTNFNADLEETVWTCIRIRLVGNWPPELVNPPTTVRIELTVYPGHPHNYGPEDVLSFVTVEKGINVIAPTAHIVYTLPPLWYWGRAFIGSTQITQEDIFATLPYLETFAQPSTETALPANPVTACANMILYLDPTAFERSMGGWPDLDPIVGVITFDRGVEIIRSLDAPTVIDRTGPGGTLSALGLLRNQPWILVVTPRGEIGLVPREGADLSRTRPRVRPELGGDRPQNPR